MSTETRFGGVRIGRARWAAGLVVPALLVVAWHVAVVTGVFPPYQLPKPTSVVETLYSLAVSGELATHISVTVQRVFFGCLVGMTVAVLLGTLTGVSRTASALLDPLFQSLKNIPSLAWVPLFLLWFGIGEVAKVLLIAVGAFFPVYLNLSTGLHAVDDSLQEIAEVYDLGRFETLRSVVFPAALPNLFVGIRNGVGLAWMFVVAAELLGASQGLGFLMKNGRVLSRPDMIVGAILLFALFGNLTDIAVKEVEKRVVDW